MIAAPSAGAVVILISVSLTNVKFVSAIPLTFTLTWFLSTKFTSVEVNGKVVNIPSYDLKPGDEVTVREKNKEQLRIKAAIELAKSKDGLSWLEVSFDDMKGKFVTYPDRSELSSEINENLIIELYSK